MLLVPFSIQRADRGDRFREGIVRRRRAAGRGNLDPLAQSIVDFVALLAMAIGSGSHVRARAWARAWYEAFPDLHGIQYASSMNANEPPTALTDRAAHAAPLPAHPDFNRPLADDALLDVLKHAAARLGERLL